MFLAPTRPARRRHRSVLLAALCAGLTSTPVGAAEPLQLEVGKAEQRWLGIRTQTAAAAQRELSLPGRVVVDPRQRQRLAAGETAYVEAPDAGFPQLGAIVQAGTVLAWLRPSLAEPARRDLQAQLAAARKDAALGALQIQRFSIDESQAVEGKLLTPSIRITSDYRTALARVAHLEHSLGTRSAIRAPVTGRLLHAAVQEGRVARPAETLFEIDGSTQTVIEVPVSAELRPLVAQASARTGDGSALQPLDARFDEASRGWVARFGAPRTEPSNAPLPGQAVIVRIAAAADAPLRVPAASLFEHDRQQWVWLHIAPEQFVTAPVQIVGRDAGSVDIRGTLGADQRIVIGGGNALTARLPRPEPRA